LHLKSINPISTAFSATPLFIPCYQYATLNVKFLGYFTLYRKHSKNAVFTPI